MLRKKVNYCWRCSPRFLLFDGGSNVVRSSSKTLFVHAECWAGWSGNIQYRDLSFNEPYPVVHLQ
ncbi:unnamed protein product [Haemonchus placei]|uniref:Ovule protein n=1 Tax=Haemonchus placei TaxID=6290 RepID=A0A158QMP0_HAEPC|nr:unnamed protein product [Haemonchus placei]